MISVKHLDKHFNKNSSNSIHVLNDITIDFPEKGLVVLLGASGSGKTTLLNVIGGLDKVDKGVINFYEHEIKRYKPAVWDKIRSHEIGYIFQNYYLMNDLSVFDNVAFVLKMIGITDQKAIEERVNYILNQVGMYRFRKKRATQLSGGQQQRVAIARALVKNPRVIIADEPTGNLDSRNTQEVMNIIKQISKTKPVILVTHEKELAQFYGDRIIEIKDGKVISDQLNNSTDDHQFDNENIIYLKDLNEVSALGSESLTTKLYADTEEVGPVEIKLIVKNKTLYLDVKSDIHKVQLVDRDSHVIIKDEHFVKQTREQMLVTTFDESKLEHSELEKSKSLAISFKTSLWIAFKRVLQFGAKGKLMLLIFAIAGALIANSLVSLYTTLTLDYRRFITMDEKIVEVDLTQTEYFGEDFDDIYNLITNRLGDRDYDILDRKTTTFNIGIYFDLENKFDISKQIPLEYSDYLSSSEIMYGRLPENRFEIVVSKAIFESGDFGGGINFKSVGIWSVEELIGEKFFDGTFMDEESDLRLFEVVGIVDRDYISIFTYDHVALASLSGQDIGEITKEAFERQMIESGYYKYYIHHENPDEIIELLKLDGIDAIYSAETAINSNEREKSVLLATNLTPSLIIAAGALLIFYFVMRSSMIKRIYEIAVYRALGVKRREIYGSFAVEIIMITTMSSILGFIAYLLISSYIANTPLSQLVSTNVDIIITILGIILIYLGNLLIGLLPMLLLLRKTPSQIISSYDM